MSDCAPVLIAGKWQPANSAVTFQATNPKTRQVLPGEFPISDWLTIDTALGAAVRAADQLRSMADAGERLSDFLERYASAIEAKVDALVTSAAEETGLAVSPRLKEVELPRTAGQLRQAAAAARSGDWQTPIIDTKLGLRSCLAPVGPVLAIGPNNFPFAYNGIAGGDFAAAIAAGNPVLAKGHPLHPRTTRLLAEAAHDAAAAAGLPAGTVQMVYHVTPEIGVRAIGDSRLKAVGFTGSRAGGLNLKAAADAAGVLFFGEMSSVNPTVILPGALNEEAAAIAEQLLVSVTAGTGQFCTKPGLVMLLAGEATERFIDDFTKKMRQSPAGTLFSEAGESALLRSIATLQRSGADLLTGGASAGGGGFAVQNTVLRTSGRRFLAEPHALQTEAFGNATMFVIADDLAELVSILRLCEGSLTGTIRSARNGEDDAASAAVANALRPRVGRLINDKMPTGVGVSAAQNHGGPYPATSQPHFTAVGMPSSIGRFTQLECYDMVRAERLPLCLRDKNPTGSLWRQIDGRWTQANVQG